MPPIEKDVNSDSSTDKNDTFEAEALKILGEFDENNKSSDEQKKKEENKDEEKEKEDKEKEDEKNKENSKKEEEELKIPRSRLNKEIAKKQEIQTKYDKLVEKIKQEETRLDSLSDDEKEEQENLRKLGMDTRLSKLQDQLEDIKDTISEKDNKIQELESTIKTKETESLSKRISELTEKYNGDNGLPKFDIKELLEFSKQKNFLPPDPLELYNYKYQAEIYAQKYKGNASEPDKGNKETYNPPKRKPTFADGDKDFEDEAKAILESLQ